VNVWVQMVFVPLPDLKSDSQAKGWVGLGWVGLGWVGLARG